MTNASDQNEKMEIRPTIPINRRRDKPQLSCNQCRRRKLKCDRQIPCGTCRRRRTQASCTYIQQPPKYSTHVCRGTGDSTRVKKPMVHAEIRPRSSSNQISVQDKISHLEGMILTMMQNYNEQSSLQPPITSEDKSYTPIQEPDLHSSDLNNLESKENAPDLLAGTFGKICLASEGTSYVDNSHWVALLDGIAELKGQLLPEKSPTHTHAFGKEFADPKGPELLYGGRLNITREQIISSLLPRPAVDKLVTKFFAQQDMAPSCIHPLVFLREYERFWENPSKTSMAWIGLLSAIICLATLFRWLSEADDTTIDTPEARECGRRMKEYRGKTVQCLLLSRYTKPQEYTIETLILYFAIEHFFQQDAQSENWITFGVIVRLSMQMGLHRDPLHSGIFTPYQIEMRRRIWACIIGIDLAVSHQNGLPRMVNFAQSDTAEPQNLTYDDFDEDTLELPPSRPDTIHTPMLYQIARTRYLKVIALITDLTTAAKPPDYSDILEMDKRINQLYQKLPRSLQIKPGPGPFIDHADLIVQRIYLALTYYRAQCMLHRKFLAIAHVDKSYAYSRQSCIKAALSMLEFQVMMHEETQSGGHLRQSRWKISSLINSDFFLAATIVCIDLDNQIRQKTHQSPTNEMMQERAALEASYKIWTQSNWSSRDAYKAARAIMVVLNKVRKVFPDTTTQPSIMKQEEKQRQVGWAEQIQTNTGAAQWPGLQASSIPNPLPLPQENITLNTMWAQPSNPSTLLDSFLVANLPQNQTLGLGGEEWTNQFTWEDWDMQMGNSNWGPVCPIIPDQ